MMVVGFVFGQSKQIHLHGFMVTVEKLFFFSFLWVGGVLRNLTLGAKAETASGKRVTHLDKPTKDSLVALLEGGGGSAPV